MNEKNNPYFNLTHYELTDLQELIHCRKSFNGFSKIKLNWVDRFIKKEHKYGYNRMCPFGIWMLCGVFLPFWGLPMFIIGQYTIDADIICGVSFMICIVIGIIFEIIYQFSYDKIDYNSLINKIAQINMFEQIGENNNE